MTSKWDDDVEDHHGGSSILADVDERIKVSTRIILQKE